MDMIELVQKKLWPENQKFHDQIVSKVKNGSRCFEQIKDLKGVNKKENSIFYEFEEIEVKTNKKRRSSSPV